MWCRYGASPVLRTDQQRAFVSKLLKRVLDTFQVKHLPTSALRPQSNGRAERMIQTLTRAVAKLVQEQQANWSRALDPILLAIRATDCATTGYSPARILYGRDLCLPADLATCPPSSREDDKASGYPLALRNELREIHRDASQHRRDAAKAMKSRYDLNARLSHFDVGDKVWLYNPRRRVGVMPALQSHWQRGWIVTHVINDILVRIQRENKKRVVHIDRIAADKARPSAQASPILSLFFCVPE